MKFLFMLLFVGILGFTPVYLFEALVMPELDAMRQNYSSYDQIANDVANGKPVVVK